MRKFEATLYKKTSTGKIQTWRTWVEGSTIYSESGQLDGKKILSTDVIKEGKNIGRSNETTPEQQALAEAHSNWESKLKKGYVLKLKDAEAGKVDDIIEGGYVAMLAQDYAKHGHKIKFPCAVQPKLDGIRCTSTGSLLWSRTRKPITSVPHISHAIRKLDDLPDFLDGELYNHDFRNDFEQITRIVGQKKDVEPDHEKVQYHIYDVPSDKPFMQRWQDLIKILSSKPASSPLFLVPTLIAKSEEELIEITQQFIEQGYEGAMARNLDAPYEHKRSYSLQKIKEFEDAEFRIIGMEEGRGKLAGHCGAFICETEDGTEFKAKMSGDTAKLKEYWDHQLVYIGKLLTVKFQGLTGKNNVPRFPVGMRIRNRDL